MDRVIKCILLKVDIILITEIIEMDAELGDPNCKLINPYQFFENGEMKEWPEVSNQRELMIHSDSILTIADPKPEIVEKYFELIS
jgi:hypothetical protein